MSTRSKRDKTQGEGTALRSHRNPSATQHRQISARGQGHRAPLQGLATISSFETHFMLHQQQWPHAKAASNLSRMPRGFANAARRPSFCHLLPVNRHPLSALQLATSPPQISTCLRRRHRWTNQAQDHQALKDAKAVRLPYNSPTLLSDSTHCDPRRTHRTSWKPTAAVRLH